MADDGLLGGLGGLTAALVFIPRRRSPIPAEVPGLPRVRKTRNNPPVRPPRAGSAKFAFGACTLGRLGDNALYSARIITRVHDGLNARARDCNGPYCCQNQRRSSIHPGIIHVETVGFPPVLARFFSEGGGFSGIGNPLCGRAKGKRNPRGAAAYMKITIGFAFPDIPHFGLTAVERYVINRPRKRSRRLHLGRHSLCAWWRGCIFTTRTETRRTA